VAVAKGALDQPPNGAATDRAAYLDAGTRTNIAADPAAVAPIVVEAVAADEVRRELAWRSMRVEFTAVPLAEIVAQFNERNTTQITLQEQSLGGLKLSGIFWLDDPESFARLLKSTLGVTTSKGPAGTILVHRE
jgi:transmembrane sensor